MPSILQKALSLLTGDKEITDTAWLTVPKDRPLKTLTERDLIRMEAEIGSQLFGPVPQGRRREFFCLDATTWIWHEEWLDNHRRLQTSTTRYEVQQKGILKVQEGAHYSYVEGEELQHIIAAINMYYERVMRQIYNVDPNTGQQLG